MSERRSEKRRRGFRLREKAKRMEEERESDGCGGRHPVDDQHGAGNKAYSLFREAEVSLIL